MKRSDNVQTTSKGGRRPQEILVRDIKNDIKVCNVI